MPSSPIIAPTLAGRLALRQPPAGPPLMRQRWGDLLFMHWPVPPALLAPFLPPRLALDLHDGHAWLAIVPFRMWDVRTRFTPPIPGANQFLELNVRTYVHLDGVPGVWFLSLDAANALAVWAARTIFHLPYLSARMALTRPAPDQVRYTARRTHSGAPAAHFATTWRVGELLPPEATAPGSLAFFLTERYCLYAAWGPRLYRGRIHHEAWPLRAAELVEFDSNLIEAHGLPTPAGAPVLYAGGTLAVELWWLQRV